MGYFLSQLHKFNFGYRRRQQLFISWLMHTLGRDRFHPDQFSVDSLEIEIANLDPAFDGYRIVHITDIHMGHWISVDRLKGVVQLVNFQNPDLIAITGDFVSYVIDEIETELVAGLAGLQPKDATLAVLGNHDHWMDPRRVRAILEKAGVVELANDVYPIQRGGAVLTFAGVDDVMVKADRLDRVVEKLPDGAPAILLAHEPDFADESAATGRFQLQLSGHSHGGQVVLPQIGPVIRGSRFMRYPNGRYQVGGMVQYTNRGVGTHVLRLRINCPPEIAVITLRAGNGIGKHTGAGS